MKCTIGFYDVRWELQHFPVLFMIPHLFMTEFGESGGILGAAYFLWLCNRVVFGKCRPDFLRKFSNSNGRKASMFIPFLVGGATAH